MKAHFDSLARYNAWANARLYEAAAGLSDAEYRADRGAFFRSMHGTLNHLLVTDKIWMQRITGQGDAPGRLDAILHEHLPALREARGSVDRRIIDHVSALSEADFAGVIRYRRITTPDVFEQPLAPAFAHLFNHQTHHRGQAHSILTGLGKPSVVRDRLAYQRLAERGEA